MTTPSRIAGALCALAVAFFLLSFAAAGCGSDKSQEPFKDAPRSGQNNDDPAEVINMPDGFSNLATKCDGHGHRVYVVYHGDHTYGSVTAINDPRCAS